MNSEPLVAIGIPAFNRPEGLRNTLNAICNQSYTNIEIYISDDCSSTPLVYEIIEEYCLKDKRIIGYKQSENLGIIKNHQFLLSKISSDIPYMMWACDDDNWHPDYIKICVESLEKHPEAVLCTTDNLWNLNGALHQVDHSEQVHTLGVSDPVKRYKQVLSNILWWNHSYYGLTRRNVYKKLPLQNVFAFDILFIAQLSLLGSFIKIRQSYFVKSIGGYGSELKQNLNAVKDEKRLSKYLPRLGVFLNLREAIKNTHFLNSSQKYQLYFASFKRIAAKSTYGQSVMERIIWLFQKGINTIKFIFIWLSIKHFRSAWQIHVHRLPIRDFKYSKKEKAVYSKRIGSVFSESSDVYNNYEEFLELHQQQQAVFTYDFALKINEVVINSIRFQLKEKFYGFLLYEIFAQQVYVFDFENPSIVIDIGANVGVSALYFAQQPAVKKVFSFEPFPETAAAAHENIDLNPALKSKIHLENFGLSDQEQTLTIDYSFKASQLASIKKGKQIQTNSPDLKPTAILIKKTSEVLIPIFNESEVEKKVLKIDTEGSEYEIIENLNKSDLLKKIDYIMLEWHGEEYRTLVDTLNNNHFEVTVVDQDYSKLFGYTGMIYARNKSLSIT